MKLNKNISPHAYVFMAVLVTFFSYIGFNELGALERWFYLPIFTLALFWAVTNFKRQQQGLSHFRIDTKIPLPFLLKRATMRYVVWAIVFIVGLFLLQSSPFSQRFEKSLQFLDTFFDIYLIIGIPYFLLTLTFKASRTEDFYDPAIRLIHITKQISLRLWHRQNKPFAVLSNAYNKKVLLNLIMRAYFIPFMVVQVYGNMNYAINFSIHDFMNYDLMAMLLWMSSLLWFMDAVCASVGYSIESRWLENRSRSIDRTISGWLICLACYEPLNQISGSIFPFGPFIANIAPQSFAFADQPAIYIFKVVEILLLMALIYSDLSLGPSGVNLTLKRLQTRGPYGIIRHPGTVCKLSLWWLQTASYTQFWMSPQLILGHLAWNVIYVLRAFSEERHLRQHPEYRDYMKRVKYRFFPGLL